MEAKQILNKQRYHMKSRLVVKERHAIKSINHK